MTIRVAAETPWYDLFSRGARDWLRHNEKVREAVKETLPELLASSDLGAHQGETYAPLLGVGPSLPKSRVLARYGTS